MLDGTELPLGPEHRVLLPPMDGEKYLFSHVVADERKERTTREGVLKLQHDHGVLYGSVLSIRPLWCIMQRMSALHAI